MSIAAGSMFPIALGAQIYYAEGLEKLAANIEEVQPTIMVVVPRLFEMLRTRILKPVEKQGGLSKYLLSRALKIGGDDITARLQAVGPADGRPAVADAAAQDPRSASAAGTRRWCRAARRSTPRSASSSSRSGSPSSRAMARPKPAPVISCNRPSVGIKLDTVGPPVKNSEVRIAEDGEILVRGENVMHGYWRNPEETARVLKDGWLHTGDIGHFDDKGRIVITDRKKDIIVNDKGDNVSPQRIEGMLTLQPEIAQAMVYGDRRPHLVALLVPDPEIANGRPTSTAASGRGRPGQRRSVGDREGPPLHPRRRRVHDRERATDAVDEDPAPRHRRRSTASGSTRSTSARPAQARASRKA